MQVTLPSSKATITYEVTKIIEESCSNNSIKYYLVDLEERTMLNNNTTHVFRIKLTTTENNPNDKGIIVLNYIFKEFKETE